MEGSTRISDLPDTITMTHSGPTPQHTMHPNGGPNGNPNVGPHGMGGLDSAAPITAGYTPMNTHPNPYGQSSPQQMAIPPPQQTKSNPYLGDSDRQGEMQMRGMPQHPLPQRDIPIDMSGYNHDEGIKPNYIPPPSSAAMSDSDYVDAQEARIRRQKKARKGRLFSGNWKMDDLIAELQQPIIVAILFLVFQSPTVHVLMARYLGFMKLFDEDGNLGNYGILFKSAIFGACYFALQRFIEYIELE